MSGAVEGQIICFAQFSIFCILFLDYKYNISLIVYFAFVLCAIHVDLESVSRIFDVTPPMLAQ